MKHLYSTSTANFRLRSFHSKIQAFTKKQTKNFVHQKCIYLIFTDTFLLYYSKVTSIEKRGEMSQLSVLINDLLSVPPKFNEYLTILVKQICIRHLRNNFFLQNFIFRISSTEKILSLLAMDGVNWSQTKILTF